MLASVVMASWLAQAEAAPAEPPGPPPAAAPLPATPPFSVAAPPPTNPPLAPLTPPAPVPPEPVVAEDQAPAPANTFSVAGRLASRLGTTGTSGLGPATGFSLGANYERRYALVAQALELGVAVDLFYDRFSQGVEGSALQSPGAEQAYAAQRILTQTSFVLLQTAATRAGPVRIWAAGGGGLTIGYFSTPELALRPGSRSTRQPVARGALGFDVLIGPRTSIGLRADFTHTLTRPTFTPDAGPTYSLFGDLLDVGVGLFYRF
jgi:hypothetical protein